MTLKYEKSIIREALATATDEKLAEMYAWAVDGNMRWSDVCGCFAGSIAAVHVHKDEDCTEVHSMERDKRINYTLLSDTYAVLCYDDNGWRNEGKGQRLVIPIIKAQIRLRDRARRAGIVAAFKESEQELHEEIGVLA